MEKKEEETSKGAYSVGGGVGGKLRKPPSRKPQSTPYSRPLTQKIIAKRVGGRWFSKFVDPATRIITGGATRILPTFVSDALFGSFEFDHHHHSGGGVGGGKLRKPPSRPPQSQTQQIQARRVGGGGWLSTATRIITGGATRILPTFVSDALFGSYDYEFDHHHHSGAEVKHEDAKDEILGAEVKHEDARDERRDERPEDISNISGPVEGEDSLAEADRPICGSGGIGSSSDGRSFSDIEKMLREKTFSRREYDRLVELLRSRDSDPSHVDERSMKTSNTATDGVLSQKILHGENREATPAPRPQSSIQDQVGASPVDIAKAYMRGRRTESGRLRDERTPLATIRFSSESSLPSPLPKPLVCWSGAMVQDQRAYQTPQKRRFGLHNLPRTPYSRPTHSRTTSKVPRKRSSPEKGFASLGPMRRTQRNSTTPYRGTSLNRFEISDASMDVLRTNNQNRVIGPSTNAGIDFQTVNDKPPSAIGISPVHPQSSDVARRILEHLDRTFPTPQKKGNELKMASSWRKPQSSSDALQHFSKGKEVANSSPFEAQVVQKKIDAATIDELKANTSASNTSSISNGFGFGGNIAIKATTPSVGLYKPDAHRKPPTPHTGRDKPALSSISIAKRDPEPPTPSILPFPSASGVPPAQEKTSLPLNKSTTNAVGEPSYSFRSNKAEDAVVFSFPFTSSGSPSGDGLTTPIFKFGSDNKDRLSFRSVAEISKMFSLATG